MTKKVVALCTEDVRYMKALASYVERNEADRLLVKPFADVNGLKEYVKDNRVDIVLIGNECREQFDGFDGRRLYVLSDERYVNEGDNYIFRYQSADEVVKQLCSICTGDELVSCAGKKQVEYTAVLSPCYPIEREIFSREFADYYGSKCKVLFVNFAPFASYDMECVHGLSEVLYYMGEGADRLKEKICGLIASRDNYKEIESVKNYRDMYAITKEEVSILLECISEIDEYDKVVFDVGHVCDAIYPLFDVCTQIVVPVMDRDNLGTARFMGDFLVDECEGYADKVSICELPDWWNVGSEMRNRWISSSEY